MLVAALAAGCSHRVAARTRPVPQENPGVFHVVQPGETLYRIARAYDVPVESLQHENALADPGNVEAGARLFIPGAQRTRTTAAPVMEISARPVAAAREGPPRAAALQWPVKGVLFSPFGHRARDQHDGIDLAAPEGTEVHAAAAGTVLFAGKQRGYGNLILVGHPGDVVTVYAHNRENLVSVGDRVDRGAVIARVGRSGTATGPHLHFEVRVAARPRDPLPFLR